MKPIILQLLYLLGGVHLVLAGWNSLSRQVISQIVMQGLTPLARIEVLRSLRTAGFLTLHDAVTNLKTSMSIDPSWYSIDAGEPWDDESKPCPVKGLIQSVHYLRQVISPDHNIQPSVSSNEGTERNEADKSIQTIDKQQPILKAEIPIKNEGQAISNLVHTVADVSHIVSMARKLSTKFITIRHKLTTVKTEWDNGLRNGIALNEGNELLWMNWVESHARILMNEITCDSLDKIKECAHAWGIDTFDVNATMIGGEPVDGVIIPKSFFVHYQLMIAGVRAAQLLNNIYDPNAADTSSSFLVTDRQSTRRNNIFNIASPAR